MQSDFYLQPMDSSPAGHYKECITYNVYIWDKAQESIALLAAVFLSTVFWHNDAS